MNGHGRAYEEEITMPMSNHRTLTVATTPIVTDK